MRPPTLSRLFVACILAGLPLLPARAADPRTDAHGDPLPDGAVARLGSNRWRTGSSIALSAFLPDGKSLLTVSQDYIVQVWERDSGKELRHFDAAGAAPTDPAAARLVLLNATANSLALSADGKTLACVGRDGSVHRWDVATGKETGKVGDWRNGTRAQLALSADGKTLVTAVYGQKTTVWNADGIDVRSFGEANADSRLMPYRMGLSPDGKTLVQCGLEIGNAAARGGRGVVGMKPTIIVWDAANGTELRRASDAAWGAGSAPTMMSAISPDAKLVAVPVGAKVKLIDTATGKEARELDGGNAQGALLFSPDGKRLVMMVGRSDALVVWDVADGKKLHDFGKAAAPAAGAVAVGTVSWVGRYGAGLAISPDGKLLAWGDGPSLRLIDLETGKEKNAAGGHAGAPREIVFNRDGKTVLTASDDGTLRRWDAATGKELGEVALPAKSYAFVFSSPDGRSVAAVDTTGTVHLIDAATGKEQHTIAPGRAVYGTSVAFSPDSRSLAVVSPISATVEIYDVGTGKEKQSLALPQPEQRNLPGGGIVIVGSRGAQRVFFSPDGRRVAAIAGNLALFDLATGREERKIELPQGASVHYATFSPDGRVIAIEAYTGQVEVWEVMSGQKRLTLNASAKPDPAAAGRGGIVSVARASVAYAVTLAFSPDGRLLAQADGNKARLWDLYTGKEAGTFDGHRGPIAGLAFAPGGKRLATGSTDTTALIWDAEPAVKKLPALATPGKDKLPAAWSALGEGDAATAYEAICRLASNPVEAVPFLAERVKPAERPDTSRVTKLIADLDSDDFDVREKAQKELEKLGELAVGPAREALKGHISAEQRRALEDLVKGAAAPTASAEQLQVARALEALEIARTPEAVKLLKQIAGGAPDTLTTQLAHAALERLGEK
jgi:WD40 repeat protein